MTWQLSIGLLAGVLLAGITIGTFLLLARAGQPRTPDQPVQEDIALGGEAE